MTKIVSGLVFYTFYNGIYFIPILFIIFILNVLDINIPKMLYSFESIRKIVAILFLASYYRTKTLYY